MLLAVMPFIMGQVHIPVSRFIVTDHGLYPSPFDVSAIPVGAHRVLFVISIP